MSYSTCIKHDDKKAGYKGVNSPGYFLNHIQWGKPYITSDGL